MTYGGALYVYHIWGLLLHSGCHYNRVQQNLVLLLWSWCRLNYHWFCRRQDLLRLESGLRHRGLDTDANLLTRWRWGRRRRKASDWRRGCWDWRSQLMFRCGWRSQLRLCWGWRTQLMLHLVTVYRTLDDSLADGIRSFQVYGSNGSSVLVNDQGWSLLKRKTDTGCRISTGLSKLSVTLSGSNYQPSSLKVSESQSASLLVSESSG